MSSNLLRNVPVGGYLGAAVFYINLPVSIPAAEWIRKSENLSFLHFVPVTN